MDLKMDLCLPGYVLSLTTIEPDNEAVNSLDAPRDTFDWRVQQHVADKGCIVLHSGMPDLVIQTSYGPVFVEVKGPRDYLSHRQANALQQLANMGFKVMLAQYSKPGDKPAKHLIKNANREAGLKRIGWHDLLQYYGEKVPELTPNPYSGDGDEQWPVIGPRGKAGVYNRKNGIIDYGHNAVRRAKVALSGDQRKY